MMRLEMGHSVKNVKFIYYFFTEEKFNIKAKKGCYNAYRQ